PTNITTLPLPHALPTPAAPTANPQTPLRLFLPRGGTLQDQTIRRSPAEGADMPHRPSARMRELVLGGPLRRVPLVALVALVAACAIAGVAAARTTASPIGTGVVVIRTTLGYQDSRAAGTGMVLTSSGEILTNNHVIRGATRITVTVPGTGRSYSAKVVGYDV